MDESGESQHHVPGLALSQRFFAVVVQPIIAAAYPQLEYAAALIGPGSEVLGFDTEISTDHHWGPRVILFLSEDDLSLRGVAIDRLLSTELPFEFLGYPTNYGPPDEIGVRLLQPIESGTVSHRVELTTVRHWFASYLGWDTTGAPGVVDWMIIPQHRLRAATTGAIFRDDTGELTAARDALAWYPEDVWYYLLAAQWQRVSEEEAFMARCGDVGDELGSILVAARLVKDVMRLCFLMERQYAPYAKWFGSAFRQLAVGRALEPVLKQAIGAESWETRQEALAVAYRAVAAKHNALGITEPLDPDVRPYYGRPYLVIGADRFADAIEARISDPDVRLLPRRLGSLNQVVDSSDTLESADNRDRLRRVYESR
jgi:hypothetical protein